MPPCTLNVASEDVADFIEQHGNIPDNELAYYFDTDCYDIVSDEYAIAYHPLDTIIPISLSNYEYIRIPKIYGLLDMTAPEAAGVTPVLDNPNLNASGQGVIIGFIDTGIDYQNPLFRFSDGSSRIIGLWDQTIQPVNAEANPLFLYGTIYTQEQINAALASENPLSIIPSTDTNGHGTFMAGVAAGNHTPGDSFTGTAPESMIAVVKLKPAKQYLRDFFIIPDGVPAYQENDIMTAIRYLQQLSAVYRAPLVIYLGLGTNQGGHTGSSPLGLLIQGISAGYGAVFVAGAGNETGYHHHYLGALQPDQTHDDVELRVSENSNGFCLELWGTPPELYTLGMVSPSGEVVEQIPNISSTETVIPFVLSNSSVTIYYMHVENASGNPIVFLRFDKPMPGIWHIHVYPSVYFTGNFHMWLPMHNFISDDTFFLQPNPDTIVTDPGNSAYVLTIAAYDHTNQQLYIHSSRGFSRNNIIVPVLAAPGVDIYGPLPTSGTTAAVTPAAGRTSAAGRVPAAGAAPAAGATPAAGRAPMAGTPPMTGTAPTTSTPPASGTAPTAGTLLAAGTTPMSGTHPVAGTAPTTGTPPASGVTPTASTLPAAGTNPMSGTPPASGVTPTAGTLPAADTAPTTGTTPAAGIAPTAGTPPAAGTAPAAGTPPAAGSAPATGTASGTGTTPPPGSAPGTGSTPTTGSAPGTGSTPTTGSAPGTGSTPTTGTTPDTGTAPAGSALPATAYTRRTGTSVAAAITAGAVADYLSWTLSNNNSGPTSNAGVVAFLIRGTVRNPNITYPSREWGYGMLNLYESFQNM